MNIEDFTLNEYHKHLEKAFIEDFCLDENLIIGEDGIVEIHKPYDEALLINQQITFFKLRLTEVYGEDIAQNLVNDIECEIPYFLNSIKSFKKIDEMLDFSDEYFKNLCIKGDKLAAIRDFNFIEELKNDLAKMSGLENKINVLTELIRKNNDKISRDNRQYGNCSKSDSFFKDQFSILLEEYEISKVDKILSLTPEQTQLSIGLTLWGCFEDNNIVEKVKQKLINAHWLNLNNNGAISFIPSGKQIKSEPASLYYALKSLDYIKTELTNAETAKMLSNTFKDFNCNVQAIGKGFKHKKHTYFKNLCKLD